MRQKQIYLDDTGLSRDDLSILLDEDQSQREKWGEQHHSIWEWLGFTGEEYGELCKAVAEEQFRDGSMDDIITEATQLATLATKIAVMAKEWKEEHESDAGI